MNLEPADHLELWAEYETRNRPCREKSWLKVRSSSPRYESPDGLGDPDALIAEVENAIDARRRGLSSLLAALPEPEIRDIARGSHQLVERAIQRLWFPPKGNAAGQRALRALIVGHVLDGWPNGSELPQGEIWQERCRILGGDPWAWLSALLVEVDRLSRFK